MSEIHNEVRVIQKAFGDKKDLILFDIGACNFNDSLYLRQHFPLATIYSFEPDKINLDRCPHQVYDSHIHVVPVALSDCDDEIKFYPSLLYAGNEHKASGSILKPKTRPGTSEGIHHDLLFFDLEGYDIQTVRIDTFCKLNDINHIDFLHMDVQGAEIKVLKGLGLIRPSFIFAETCEFDTYESGITESEFDQFMDSLGYEIINKFRDDTLYKLKNELIDFKIDNWLPKL
jgi:FkbM family methyltransferase